MSTQTDEEKKKQERERIIIIVVSVVSVLGLIASVVYVYRRRKYNAKLKGFRQTLDVLNTPIMQRN